MLKKYKLEIIVGLLLLVFSISMYALHYYFYRSMAFISGDLLLQLGYLPIYILITSVIIDRTINRRSKLETLRRLNTIVGIFFSEIGMDLIRIIIKFDRNFHLIQSEFISDEEWNEDKSKRVKSMLCKYNCNIDSKSGDIDNLEKFLLSHKASLVNLMGNPNLMEHEEFTEMLISIFHLTEEILIRKSQGTLSDADYEHLSLDIKRSYYLLVYQWIRYIEHLKKHYPFLYGFIIKVNPFSN